MPCLGGLELGRLPRIAVSVTDRTPRRLLDRLPRSGLDVAEARIDLYESKDPAHVVKHLSRLRPIARLGTIRSPDEGGRWEGSDAERLALFREIMPHVEGVDVELAAGGLREAVVAEARRASKLVVVSHHDFERTPPLAQLRAFVEQALEAGADVVKLATSLTRPDDLRALARLVLEQPRPRLVVLGMGAQGVQSRVLLPALGSLLTFAFAGTPTAPGQLPFDEMFALFKRLYPEFAEAKRGGPQEPLALPES